MKITFTDNSVLCGVKTLADDDGFSDAYLIGYHTDGNNPSIHWFLIRECSLDAAFSALVDDDEAGRYLRIEDENLEDYRLEDDSLDISWTDGGTPYDPQYLMIGEKTIKRIEFEASDYHSLSQKLLEDDVDVDTIEEAIVEGMAECTFALEYADLMERSGTQLHGEILDQIPEVPTCYRRWAQLTAIRQIEHANGHHIVVLWAAASAIPPVNSWENHVDVGCERDAMAFGRSLVLHAFGTGSRWEDSHAALPFTVPVMGEPNFLEDSACALARRLIEEE